jgi:HEPN domain-containing protein
MKPEAWRRNEASRWLALATKDLHASSLLAAEEPSMSVFHSQQAAEKSLKALLTLHNVYFRKTHDLEEPGRQCAAIEPALSPLLAEAEGLTDYAVVFRYLDAPCEPDEAEAANSLAVARRLCVSIQDLAARRTVGESDGDGE